MAWTRIFAAKYRLLLFILALGCVFHCDRHEKLFAQAFAMPVAEPADDLQHATILRALQTTICIFPADEAMPAGGGSGVLISRDGYALTNFHVVQPCGPSMKCALWEEGMAVGKLYDAVIVGLDPVGDLALIKLLGRNDFPVATLANSDLVRAGDPVFVAGNPFLLALDFRPSLSRGIVSGTHRYQFPSGTFLEYTDCIQTDAAVNPGNSGGPLFNDRGEIIGIVGRCSFDKRGRNNVGIGYAISGNQVRNFLGVLKSGRIVDHASLSAVLSTDKEGRVLIDDVLETSDAYRNGLRYNDELLRFAGQTIESANAFKNRLGIFPPHWRLPITVRGHDGMRHDFFVRLSRLHGEAELLKLMEQILEPPVPSTPPKKDSVPETPPEFPPIASPKEYTVSEAAKPFYESAQGFANFYFNKMERDRVLKNWRNTFKTKETDPTWEISGVLSESQAKIETRFSFRMNDAGVQYELPNEKGFWDAQLMKQEQSSVRDPLIHYQSPRGSGGLFPALFLLHQLAHHENLERMEVLYGGTAPLDGQLEKLYDVLSVNWNGNEFQLYFDNVFDATNKTESSFLVYAELMTSSLDFPCEIRFERLEEQPTMTVQYGPMMYGAFPISSFPLEFRPPKMAGQEQAGEKREPETDILDTKNRAVIATSLEKVVKIYGAGSENTPGMPGYQTGILLSSEGHILTALTPCLNTDRLNVVLPSGQKYEATLIAAEPEMELAVLKISGMNLPHFVIFDTKNNVHSQVQIGDDVIAVSNPFNISVGSEPATIQRGVIAAKTTLQARRGVFETPYQGDIYVTDIITNNPGVCGGALILAESGEFIGILGKELRHAGNQSWLNYAIPTENFRSKIQNLIDSNEKGTGKRHVLHSDMRITQEMIPEDTIQFFQERGLLLVSAISERTPPFIDTIKPDSDAATLGLLPDDLIVMIDGQLTPSIKAVELLLRDKTTEEPMTLTIERHHELLDFTFP